MAIAEDRRRRGNAAARGCGWRCIVVFVGLLAGGFWFLQVVQHAQVRGDGREQPPADAGAARAARHAVRPRRARCSSRTGTSFNISIVREHTKDLDRTIAAAGAGGRRRRGARARDRRAPPPRAGLPADRRRRRTRRWRRWRPCTARRLDFELPDVVVEQVPTRRYPGRRAGGAPVRLRRRGQRRAGRRATSARLHGRRHRRAGGRRAASTTALLMGEDGARRVVVNSVGREIRTLEERAARRGPPPAADDRRRRAAGGRGRVPAPPATGARRSCSTRATARCWRSTSLPAYDPNAFAAGIDRATWAALNTDQLRPLQNRAIQGRYSPGSTFKIVVADRRARGRADHARLHASTAAGGATFYGRFFKCHLGGRPRPVDMRHAIEKSCNVYFYTLGNMLGVDRIHKWARAARPGGQERDRPAERGGEHRAVDRVEAAAHGREVVRGRDDLGRRSARARCR